MSNQNTPGRKCDVSTTKMSINGQLKVNCSSVNFWNQGTSEVVIDGAIRLAPAQPDTLNDGHFRGGESFTFEDPTGRINTHTFNFVFQPNLQNNLVITMMTHIDD